MIYRLQRREVVGVGLISLLAGLAGCAKQSDYTTVDAALGKGLSTIPGAKTVRAWWGPSGISQAVVVDLRITRPDREEARRVMQAILDIVGPLTHQVEGNGELTMRIFGPTDDHCFFGTQEGFPHEINEIRKLYP